MDTIFLYVTRFVKEFQTDRGEFVCAADRLLGAFLGRPRGRRADLGRSLAAELFKNQSNVGATIVQDPLLLGTRDRLRQVVHRRQADAVNQEGPLPEGIWSRHSGFLPPWHSNSVSIKKVLPFAKVAAATLRP